jgi:hypothetical protein
MRACPSRCTHVRKMKIYVTIFERNLTQFRGTARTAIIVATAACVTN